MCYRTVRAGTVLCSEVSKARAISNLEQKEVVERLKKFSISIEDPKNIDGVTKALLKRGLPYLVRAIETPSPLKGVSYLITINESNTNWVLDKESLAEELLKVVLQYLEIGPRATTMSCV